jgi:hypothetical protein
MYLMHLQFLGFREDPATLAASPAFYKQLRDTMKTIAPLVEFLNEPLVASQQPDKQAHMLSDQPVRRGYREDGLFGART